LAFVNTNTNEPRNKKIICLTPIYNDWESFSILVKKIEKEYLLQQKQYLIQIVAINDGSIEEFEKETFNTTTTIELVNLKVNVGHQRAIAIGLQYINDTKTDFDFVIVLDSDGEDNPEDILHLVAKCESLNSSKIIFAQRKKDKNQCFLKQGISFINTCFIV